MSGKVAVREAWRRGWGGPSTAGQGLSLILNTSQPHHPNSASIQLPSPLCVCHCPEQGQGAGCRLALEVISWLRLQSQSCHHAPSQAGDFGQLVCDLTLFPLCALGRHRRGDQEAAQQHPAEHGDRNRCGDAEPGHAPGQPRVHRREHQQQQLRRHVRSAHPPWPPPSSLVLH